VTTIPDSRQTAEQIDAEAPAVGYFKTRRGRQLIIDLIYVLPQYILYVGLQLLPFVIAIPIVFTDQVDFLDQDIDFIGFDNILSVFNPPLDERFFEVLRRTVIFSIVRESLPIKPSLSVFTAQPNPAWIGLIVSLIS